MDLYFAPLACSMATHIAAYEARCPLNFILVDLRSKRLPDGSDFLAVNPMGQVPVLKTATGAVLTENPVVLQFIADQHPESQLAPSGGMARYRLQQWLSFVTSELHKAVFAPLLSPLSNAGAKEFARSLVPRRLQYLNAHLESRTFLLDGFSVADCYLATVLNWTAFCDIDLKTWPAVLGYFHSLRDRPSVARALSEEIELFQEEQKRRNAG